MPESHSALVGQIRLFITEETRGWRAIVGHTPGLGQQIYIHKHLSRDRQTAMADAVRLVAEKFGKTIDPSVLDWEPLETTNSLPERRAAAI